MCIDLHGACRGEGGKISTTPKLARKRFRLILRLPCSRTTNRRKLMTV
jgi:hypothetical protein